MPVIQTFSPFGAALETAASYMQQKKQNQVDAQNQELQRAMLQSQLETAAANRNHQQFEEKRETAGDIAAAKAEAANELHQQRDDAIKLAQVQLAASKDRHEYDLKVREINQKHADAIAKLHNDQTVAEIHASATMGAAQIHAAATVEAAGIHASAEERGQDISHADRIRGQDLTHQDRVRGQNLTTNRNAAMQAELGVRATAARLKIPTPTDPTFSTRLHRWFSESPSQQKAMVSSGYFSPDELKYLSSAYGGGSP